MATTNAPPDDRVLVLAPTALDAAMTQSILGEAGLRSESHSTCGTLVESMERNAGAVLLTEMAILDHTSNALKRALQLQPAWSDIPVILLAGGGTDSPTAVNLLETFGNVTVLERPTHVVTLVSTLRSAIKARKRQYELRDRIIALEKAEETVGNSERQFRRLVETAREGIWQVDLEGHTTYVNQRLCDMLGVTVEEMLNAPAETFFHADEVPRIRERVRNRKQSTGDTTEWHLRRADGTYICVLSSATPVRDGAGTMIGAFAMMTDITDRKESEQALRDSTKRKDEFIAVLAHELRNPLAPIRSSLEILRYTEELESSPAPVLDMLDRQVNHMVHLVDELLEISRISTGVIELHQKLVTIESIVETAVDASTPHIRAAGHDLRVDLPDKPIWVNADSVRMAQVLTNLLNNAAKYSERGGHITLSARVCAEGEASPVVELCVSDTGVGIARENLQKVFEMFSQIDREVGRAHHGLGIGLALAKNLVHLHGGTIEAESPGAGHGSVFVIRLPYDANAQQDMPSATDTPSQSAGAKLLDHRHILVVDDNADAANSVSALLRASGATVDVAYDGEHALALWRHHQHPTILLDIGMPVMDGYELAKLIRDEPDGAAPVLIALTGWGQRDDRVRTREAGIDYHLVKPIEFDTLQRLLLTFPAEGAAR